MREKVRRSFVTDLAGFRHLFIRQPEGFVIRATGPDLAYDIDIHRSHCSVLTDHAAREGGGGGAIADPKAAERGSRYAVLRRLVRRG